MKHSQFDVVVIGGGHAGAEATRVAARAGFVTAMISMDRLAIGRMSCNPAIGGLAKGHLVKEIDALGGLMGEATDAAAIQYKVLNRSKGPAVHGPRAQCDRDLYAAAVQNLLSLEDNVRIVEGNVSRLSPRDGGFDLILADGTSLAASAVIVTTGTFLRALMHSGETKTVGGRFGEQAAVTLSDSLRDLGLRLGRLKTGTPPRVDRRTVDFSGLEEAPGDVDPRPFSILTDRILLPQVLCHVTYTSSLTHELILANLHRAPMYSGQIAATGPRYCPSIEDKVVRFADKERHQIFVEPEGLTTDWLYLNGISTSLPADIQDGVVRSLAGFENAEIVRYGYAVEYDFVNPEQLDPTLQVRDVPGLFLAGQINGTSGYEEAAAQGLMAGINAALYLKGEPPSILSRDQAYLGVLIDDLVTLGTEEPYRMFTSRAEHRLLLGCDSVYERLSPLAASLGILDEERRRRAEARNGRLQAASASITEQVRPDRATTEWLERCGISIQDRTTVAGLMKRRDFSLEAFLAAASAASAFPEVVHAFASLSQEESEAVLHRARYEGYLEREKREADRLRNEDAPIPQTFDFRRPGLSTEIREKLSFARPRTLSQASRIPGVTPAAISVLRMHLRSRTSHAGE